MTLKPLFELYTDPSIDDIGFFQGNFLMKSREIINTQARASYAARRAKHLAAVEANAAIDADNRAAAAYTALVNARLAFDKIRKADTRKAGNAAADKARAAAYHDASIPPEERDAAARAAAAAARRADHAAAARFAEEAAHEASKEAARAGAAAACAAHARRL